MGAEAGELREIPGSKTRAWLGRAEDVSVKTTVSSRLVFIAGEGAYLYDADENQYLDCGSPGTNFMGYGEVLEREFLPELERVFLGGGLVRFATADWFAAETIAAKEKILDAVPLSGKGLILGARSGGAAIESSLKVMRKARSGKERPLVFWGAFHGRPHGALSLVDPHKRVRIEHYRLPYDALRIKFPYRGHPYPERLVDEEFGRLHSANLLKDIPVIFIELVQGEGGIRVIDSQALDRIYKWCRGYDIAVLFDEIQTGMGRTGSRWCYEQYGIRPDLVSLGKALGGNVEDCNALVIREDLSFKELGEESSTFDLPPLEAAIAVRALELLERYELPAGARYKGMFLDELLQKAFSGKPYVKDVRGLGLMRGIEFTSAAFRNEIIREAEKRGLLLLGAGFSEDDDMTLVSGPVIRWMPPLTVTEKELALAVEIGLSAYEEALRKLGSQSAKMKSQRFHVYDCYD